MNITEQIEAAMSKLLEETGLEANCITLHPEHHTQLINEFKEQVSIDPAVKEPIWYRGIPVYKAELPDDRDMTHRNPCLMEGFSIVGHYDSRENYYVKEQHFHLVSQ